MNRTKPLLKIPYFQHYFPDEQACQELIFRVIGDSKIHCPHCNRKIFVYSIRKPMQCHYCKKFYPLTIGTIFQSTRMSLHTIFAMIWLLTCSKKSINTRETMEVLHLKSYRITWQWMQKIRMKLNFIPAYHKKDTIETDSFLFRVKSKNPAGTIVPEEVEIMIIISRERTYFRLLRMTVISGKSKSEKNQIIRDTLPYGGIICVPDKTWFYSDERRFYKARIGTKSKIYQPHCRLTLPDMVARKWNHWVKDHYHNNIHEEHLQGYLNAFVFYFNQPEKTKLPEYFHWIIENIWQQKA